MNKNMLGGGGAILMRAWRGLPVAFIAAALFCSLAEPGFTQQVKAGSPALSGAFSVKEFGAVGDGETDDTSAIRATIAAASLSGNRRMVYIPMGEYICKSAITIPTNVSIIGDDVRVYHLWYDQHKPRMPVLRFVNDTDGLVFQGDFFKVQIKNLGVWSGVPVGSSNGVGLRLSANRHSLMASTSFEGLGDTYENIEINGFKLGIKLSGALSWFQHFNAFQVNNCETAIDIECRSCHAIRFENYYINCDGSAWKRENRVGLVMRSGGRVFLDNGIVENVCTCFELADPAYSDMNTSADSRQLYVHNLHSEAYLKDVFRIKAPGYLKVDNMRASYAFFGAGSAVFRLQFGSRPRERTYIDANEVQILGDPAPSDRRIRKVFASDANSQPDTYQVVLNNVEVFKNDFETMWDKDFPPNKLTFKQRDNAGNLVEVYQSTGNPGRAYAVLENERGNVPKGSLCWTNESGNVLNLMAMPNHLQAIDPVRCKQSRNHLPIYMSGAAGINNTALDANQYSGVKYVNQGEGPASISIHVDMGLLNVGDEFLVSDTSGSRGATCQVSVGGQSFLNQPGQFMVIRKVLTAGSSQAVDYQIVARGPA